MATHAGARDEIVIQKYYPAGGSPSEVYLDSVARLDLRSGTAVAFAPLVEGSGAGSGVFSELSVWSAFRSGAVVSGTTHAGSFRFHSPEGRLVREIRLPLTPREVTPASIERMTEEYGINPLSPSRSVPREPQHHRIAIRLETIDDSTFALVHTSVSGPEEEAMLELGETVWRLFMIDGTPAGVIRFPPWFRPWSVTGDRVLGVLQDSLGASILQEYRLDPPVR